MCIFSGTIRSVASTHILARRDGARQWLAYAMEFSSAADVAMVLPIPVAADSGEDAIEFVNLETIPDLFKRIDVLWPLLRSRGPVEKAAVLSLKIHDVGAFEASYVPAIADFGRLDARFRLPDAVWSRLPQYTDFGFVVFKLKGADDQQKVHPMAFSFPTRDSDQLFFPTVHVHDGEVHANAQFDHRLYVHGVVPGGELKWSASEPVGSDLADASCGLLSAGQPVYRTNLHGEMPNKDVTC